MKESVLIIDDEVNIGLLLSKFLTRNNFEVETVISGNAAIELLNHRFFHFAICDYRLEDMDGRDILIKIKELHPSTAVIIITGYSDVKLAVELIKLGAYDYITKPLYPDEILNTLHKASKHLSEFSQTSKLPTKELVEKEGCSESNGFIVGSSQASLELQRQIKIIAPTCYSIIIMGESGTGKECVAKAIHLQSNRKHMPFVAMDCGSLSKELAGSEFFGHEKGAFTGALYTKIGHFEMANGGTLFLDEVGNLSYEIQALLLRAVQERRIKRIGSTKEIDIDVRIIVATNENLKTAIQRGAFREDLYHRFNEFSLQLAPLRQRDSDVLLFAKAFLKEANIELNKNIIGFNPEVKEIFLNYSWPGNVRELKNVIRRVALLTDEDWVKPEALPLEIVEFNRYESRTAEYVEDEIGEVQDGPKLNLKEAALEAEYEAILAILKQVNFNKTKAAKILNIDRKTLYNKMNLINILKPKN